MFSDPQKNIEQFNLPAGATVADIGAGSGFYAFAVAKAVTGSGKVYAIDIQNDLLQKLKKEAHLRKITNIEVLRGNAEKVRGTGLKDGAVDAAVVANILFQIEDKNSFVAEVSRILKPSGWVLVVEWSDSWKGMGPEVSRIVRKEDAKRLFLSVGFSFERDIIAGEHHYGIIFKKN